MLKVKISILLVFGIIFLVLVGCSNKNDSNLLERQSGIDMSDEKTEIIIVENIEDKPTGVRRWVLWVLLVLVISYAIYRSVRWQHSKREEKICLCCGQKNDEDAIYCKICGIKIVTQDEYIS